MLERTKQVTQLWNQRIVWANSKNRTAARDS